MVKKSLCYFLFFFLLFFLIYKFTVQNIIKRIDDDTEEFDLYRMEDDELLFINTAKNNIQKCNRGQWQKSQKMIIYEEDIINKEIRNYYLYIIIHHIPAHLHTYFISKKQRNLYIELESTINRKCSTIIRLNISTKKMVTDIIEYIPYIQGKVHNILQPSCMIQRNNKNNTFLALLYTDITTQDVCCIVMDIRNNINEDNEVYNTTSTLETNQDNLKLYKEDEEQISCITKHTLILCTSYQIGNTIELESHGKICQIYWHPLSDHHLCVLYTDGLFCIFDITVSCSIPEQIFLSPLSNKQLYNSNHISWNRDINNNKLEIVCNETIAITTNTTITIEFVDFCFGSYSQPYTWDIFTVYAITLSGDIYILCPIVPNNIIQYQKDVADFYIQQQIQQYDKEKAKEILKFEQTNSIQCSTCVRQDDDNSIINNKEKKLQEILKKIIWKNTLENLNTLYVYNNNNNSNNSTNKIVSLEQIIAGQRWQRGNFFIHPQILLKRVYNILNIDIKICDICIKVLQYLDNQQYTFSILQDIESSYDSIYANIVCWYTITPQQQIVDINTNEYTYKNANIQYTGIQSIREISAPTILILQEQNRTQNSANDIYTQSFSIITLILPTLPFFTYKHIQYIQNDIYRGCKQYGKSFGIIKDHPTIQKKSIYDIRKILNKEYKHAQCVFIQQRGTFIIPWENKKQEELKKKSIEFAWKMQCNEQLNTTNNTANNAVDRNNKNSLNKDIKFSSLKELTNINKEIYNKLYEYIEQLNPIKNILDEILEQQNEQYIEELRSHIHIQEQKICINDKIKINSNINCIISSSSECIEIGGYISLFTWCILRYLLKNFPIQLQPLSEQGQNWKYFINTTNSKYKVYLRSQQYSQNYILTNMPKYNIISSIHLYNVENLIKLSYKYRNKIISPIQDFLWQDELQRYQDGQRNTKQNLVSYQQPLNLNIYQNYQCTQIFNSIASIQIQRYPNCVILMTNDINIKIYQLISQVYIENVDKYNDNDNDNDKNNLLEIIKKQDSMEQLQNYTKLLPTSLDNEPLYIINLRNQYNIEQNKQLNKNNDITIEKFIIQYTSSGEGIQQQQCLQKQLELFNNNIKKNTITINDFAKQAEIRRMINNINYHCSYISQEIRSRLQLINIFIQIQDKYINILTKYILNIQKRYINIFERQNETLKNNILLIQRQLTLYRQIDIISSELNTNERKFQTSLQDISTRVKVLENNIYKYKGQIIDENNKPKEQIINIKKDIDPTVSPYEYLQIKYNTIDDDGNNIFGTQINLNDNIKATVPLYTISFKNIDNKKSEINSSISNTKQILHLYIIKQTLLHLLQRLRDFLAESLVLSANAASLSWKN